MEKINRQHYYINKLEKVELLESKNYRELEIKQKTYDERINFYQKKKDHMGTKIRMLEVYQNIWEDLESQMGGQAFLNEEFWNNIAFNILKYNKFIQELDEIDYDTKIKNSLDKKINEDLWDQRQQTFMLMKNDLNHMYTSFNKMHSEIHRRSLLQRKCIEKHIDLIKIKVSEVEIEKESYRSVFHEIRKDIGVNGNKISRQALEHYKVSIIEKSVYANMEFDRRELDLA